MSSRDNQLQPLLQALACADSPPLTSGSATLHPCGLQVLIHDFLFLYLTFRGAGLFQSLKTTNKAPGEGTPHPPPRLHSILQLPTQSLTITNKAAAKICEKVPQESGAFVVTDGPTWMPQSGVMP